LCILGANCAAATARFAATVTPSGSNYSVSFTGTLSGSSATTYQWQGYAAGAGTSGTPLWTSTSATPGFSYTGVGTYWVCLTINAGTPCASQTCMPITIGAMNCGNISLAANNDPTAADIIIIDKITNTAFANTELGNLLVYPNPATDLLHIAWSNAANTPVTLQLVDVLGNAMQQVNLPQGTDNAQFDTHDLPSGVYLILLTNNGKRLTQRVIIAR
jgi:hypothetical protein